MLIALYINRESLKDYKEVITALATVIIAWFTKTLFEATDEIRKGGEETTAVAMIAQQTAMEDMAKAMRAMADASAGSEEIIRRQFVRDSPPIIRLDSARLVVAENHPVYIMFQISNRGYSDATVRRCFLHDTVLNGELPKARPFPSYDSTTDKLIGKTISYGSPILSVFTCSETTAGMIPPEPSIEEILRRGMMGIETPASPEIPHIRFSGSVEYHTESGTPSFASFSGTCKLPYRNFDVDADTR